MPQPITGFFLGRRPYLPIAQLMQDAFDARRAGHLADCVLLLEHEPVITLGRAAKQQHLLVGRDRLAEWDIDLAETGRGGDVTLHAPGQLVAYPIVDLSPERRDVRKYVANLAEVMRRIAGAHGVDSGMISGLIGLWTDLEDVQNWPGEERVRTAAKLGAIGVRISRWVTSHGFALNLSTDLSLFSLIVPCGIQEHGVTSIAQLTGTVPDLSEEAHRAHVLINDLLGAPHAGYVNLEHADLDVLSRRVLSAK